MPRNHAFRSCHIVAPTIYNISCLTIEKAQETSLLACHHHRRANHQAQMTGNEIIKFPLIAYRAASRALDNIFIGPVSEGRAHAVFLGEHVMVHALSAASANNAAAARREMLRHARDVALEAFSGGGQQCQT